jgi:hypothetical protein
VTAGATRRSGDLDYHLARVLLLVTSFTETDSDGVDGLTKLAKLDFLLRYPSMLDRVLQAIGHAWPEGTEPSEDERDAVESSMVRYKYGPWDDRYYPITGALLGLGLAELRPGRGRVALRATAVGRAAAAELARSAEWAVTARRTELLARTFAGETGNALKQLVYRLLPDAVDRPHRQLIAPPTPSGDEGAA